MKKKKKSEKSEIEQNMCVLQIMMQKWAFYLRVLQKIKRPPNHSNKRAVLEHQGFTEAKWVVATKSEHSYTKREVATVQGAQQ